MGKVPIDLNMAGLIPPGSWQSTITGLTYQIKTGESWNKNGTQDADYDTWAKYEDELRRLNYEFTVMFKDPRTGETKTQKYFKAYHKIGAGGGIFLRQLLKAAKAPFGKDFDPDDAVNKTVGLNMTIEDDEEYGPKSVIAAYYQV